MDVDDGEHGFSPQVVITGTTRQGGKTWYVLRVHHAPIHGHNDTYTAVASAPAAVVSVGGSTSTASDVVGSRTPYEILRRFSHFEKLHENVKAVLRRSPTGHTSIAFLPKISVVKSFPSGTTDAVIALTRARCVCCECTCPVSAQERGST